MSSTGLDIALMIDQFLLMRRGMGYTLRGQGRQLLDFAKFFQNTRAEHVSTPLSWTERLCPRTRIRPGGTRVWALFGLSPSSSRP